jgi:hypothetical protein
MARQIEHTILTQPASFPSLDSSSFIRFSDTCAFHLVPRQLSMSLVYGLLDVMPDEEEHM